MRCCGVAFLLKGGIADCVSAVGASLVSCFLLGFNIPVILYPLEPTSKAVTSIHEGVREVRVTDPKLYGPVLERLNNFRIVQSPRLE